MSFKGRVAVVTGGASGIGAATARRLAEGDATVVVVDVDDQRGQDVVHQLDGDHHYRHLDVTDVAGWCALLAELDSNVGPVDIFHLNAGIMSRRAGEPALSDPLETAFSEDAYRRVMAVNVDGVFLGILAALPHLAGREADILVTVSALTGAAPDPIYGMSKLALVGLVWGLAPSLAARGVRLNGICPGLTDTAIVPADIHDLAADFMNSPDYIADGVAAILETASTGDVWYAPGPSLGLWRVQPPSLPMEIPRNAAGMRLWGAEPAPSSPAVAQQ